MTSTELKHWRTVHNLTTSQLSELLPVSRRTIEGWEQGRTIPAYLKRALSDIERELIKSPRL